MPRGDGTGPNGMGQMTGRGAGYCAGYPVPGYENPVGGGRNGFGSAAGRGRGGRGNRNRYQATGLTGWQRAGMSYPMSNAYNPVVPQYALPNVQPYAPTREQEMDALKGQSKYLEDELSVIHKRLKELGAEKADK